MRYPYPLWLVSAGVVAALFCAALRAEAQPGPPCGNRDAMLAGLAEGQWQETVTGRGLEGAPDEIAAMVEITSNPSTGTWTILRTMPGGPTCIMAVGQAWEVPDAPAPEPKGEGL